ncbi:hypothetical protein [Spirulina sp. 06S082]|uniref:hypothetical protein n=1 Tax=Spirulina sp. 06S082 TaxID=3110248 RepID=UPI002B20792A|nr:hypothetical protein [Spirulina sp. 06S082]MEA5469417.1 hypothetical protein [Spirulina sp. 06S082]
MKDSSQQYTTQEKVALYQLVRPFLEDMTDEFKELSKKKPDTALSINKVKMVNRLLESCRKVLEEEKSLQFLDLIDEDNIPQNSDVVLMLSQYVVAMGKFRSNYYDTEAAEDDLFRLGDQYKDRWFTHPDT